MSRDSSSAGHHATFSRSHETLSSDPADPRNLLENVAEDDRLFFLDEEDFHVVFQEDYYTRLNLDHNASQEEIRDSYRRLSRLLHPDKHVEPYKKALAEDAFNRINAAYEVLKDPYRRSLYDAAGVSGINSDIWQMMPMDPAKAKSPDELRREKEKRKEKESTNPHNELSMGVDATDLFEGTVRNRKDYGILQRYAPQLEITTLSAAQTIEAPWPQVDRFQLFSNVNYERGTGGGVCGFEVTKTVAPQTVADCKVMTGPSRGLVSHLRLTRRLTPSRTISLSTFSAFSRFGMMPLMEIAYSSQLGIFGNGRLIVRGSTKVINVGTRIDKDLKTGRLSVFTDTSRDDVNFGMTYSHKLNLLHEPKLTVGFKVGFRGASVEYGISRRVSKYNQLAASMSVSLPGGCSLRITFQRSTQVFSFPILLSNDVLPAPIFYGTLAPLVVYACVRSMYLLPRWKLYLMERIRSRRNAYQSGLEENRKEYDNFVKLMAEKYEEMIDAEGLSGGLVIERAIYGQFVDNEPTSLTIEVQVALQCLVRNRHLHLPPSSKSELPGFYSPCVNEPQRLRVWYFFGGRRHLVDIADTEALLLPSEEHLLIG